MIEKKIIIDGVYKLSSAGKYLISTIKNFFDIDFLKSLGLVRIEHLSHGLSEVKTSFSVIKFFLRIVRYSFNKNKNLENTAKFFSAIIQSLFSFLTLLTICRFLWIPFFIVGLVLDLSISLIKLIYCMANLQRYRQSSEREAYMKAINEELFDLRFTGIWIIILLLVTVFPPALFVHICITLITFGLFFYNAKNLYEFFKKKSYIELSKQFIVVYNKEKKIDFIANPSNQRSKSFCMLDKNIPVFFSKQENKIKFQTSFSPHRGYYHESLHGSLTDNCCEDRQILIKNILTKLLQISDEVKQTHWREKLQLKKRQKKIEAYCKFLIFLLLSQEKLMTFKQKALIDHLTNEIYAYAIPLFDPINLKQFKFFLENESIHALLALHSEKIQQDILKKGLSVTWEEILKTTSNWAWQCISRKTGFVEETAQCIKKWLESFRKKLIIETDAKVPHFLFSNSNTKIDICEAKLKNGFNDNSSNKLNNQAIGLRRPLTLGQ